MFELAQGDLLASDAEAIVNTVNTKGVMGKGVALQFKKAFPENYKVYRKACELGEVRPGRMFVFDRGTLTSPRYIINFPTKRHWRSKSRMADIEAGLHDLVEVVERLGVQSVALPPLGSGLGGLWWPDVRDRMQRAFDAAPAVRWLVYEPQDGPDPKAMTNRSKRPRMTAGAAAIVGLLDRYLVPGFDYPVSLLEIHKLIYFLTAAGEPLRRLTFVKHHYGPYADVLRHMLERMDGHFTVGYGAGENKPETPISLLPGATDEAEAFLAQHPATLERFERVARLIEGFETPFGMELLATVHWTAVHEGARDADEALTLVRDWNTRKAGLMTAPQIAAAWQRLDAEGWLPAPA